jgi:hypothetical protein
MDRRVQSAKGAGKGDEGGDPVIVRSNLERRAADGCLEHGFIFQ